MPDGPAVLRAAFRGRDLRTTIIGNSTASDGNLDENGIWANVHLNFITDFIRVVRA